MDIFKQERKSAMDLGDVYFWTSTIHEWQHLLKPDKYKEIIISSLSELSKRGKILVYGFVIMPNHIHLIWELLEMNGKEKPYASFDKFTSNQIKKDLRVNHPLVLDRFYVGEYDRAYRFWKRDPLAIKIKDKKMLEQKLDYIHSNPQQSHWNLVERPEDYYYSSASFYEENRHEFDFLRHYMDRY